MKPTLDYSRTLSVFAVIFAIFTAFITEKIVIQSYSPVTYWDQWVIVYGLIQHGGHETLANLWAQHNEHRIPIGRLAVDADLFYFGGRDISVLVEIFIIQLLHLSLFAWMVRRFGNLTSAAWWTAFGFLLFCFFSPLQIDNFIWGLPITFVMAGLAASAAFASAVWYAQIAGRPGSFSVVPLMACAGAAFVAEGSLASGTLVWLILWMLAYTLKFPKRAKWFLWVTGVCALAAYLRHYASPPQHADPIQTLRSPLAVGRYILTYLASSWDAHVPGDSPWPAVSEILTALAVIAATVAAARFFLRRSQPNPLHAFLAANVVFVLASASITALGRATFGLVQATSSRYQTIALVFWACLGMFLLAWSGCHSASGQWLRLIQASILILMIGSASRFSASETWAMDRQRNLNRGFTALAQNSMDPDALKLLYPDIQQLPAWYQYMRAHHMGPDPTGYITRAMSTIAPSATPAAAGIGAYRLEPAARCLGFIDVTRAVPGQPDVFDVTGWAWDVGAGSPPSKVVLDFADGTAAGTATATISRPDVMKDEPRVTAVTTGWNTTLRVPSGSTIRAFAVLADAKSACPLTNEFHAP